MLSEDFLFLTHFCSFSRASPSVSPPSPPPSSLSSSSLQMPNTVQRASSARRLVLAATLYPRASAPRWTKALTMLRWRPKVSIPPGRKHWSSSSAGSKGRGRRTAGRTTSRLAADFSSLQHGCFKSLLCPNNSPKSKVSSFLANNVKEKQIITIFKKQTTELVLFYTHS